eukprot:m.32273 g.32273  ORF g.32273 m.32273 type:complete len:88 (+) comp7024_c0_seq1:907-1170(+)
MRYFNLAPHTTQGTPKFCTVAEGFNECAPIVDGVKIPRPYASLVQFHKPSVTREQLELNTMNPPLVADVNGIALCWLDVFLIRMPTL